MASVATSVKANYSTDIPHFLLHLQSPLAAFNRLVAILFKHEDTFYSDPLSKKLSDWSFELLDLLHCQRGFSEGIDRDVGELVNKLALEILVNPHDGSPLEDPVIIDGMLYEKWMVEHFMEVLRGASRILPTAKSPPSHMFAKEMIDFIDHLYKESGNMGYVAWSREVKIAEGVAPQDYQQLAKDDPETHAFECQEIVRRASELNKELQAVIQLEAGTTLESIEYEAELGARVEAACEEESAMAFSLRSQLSAFKEVSDRTEALGHRILGLEEKKDSKLRSLHEARDKHCAERSALLAANELQIEAERRIRSDTIQRLSRESKERNRADETIIHELQEALRGVKTQLHQRIYEVYFTLNEVAYRARQHGDLKSQKEQLTVRVRDLAVRVSNNW